MIAADLLFPAACAVLSWVLVGRISRRRLPRLSMATCLPFAQELLSLGRRGLPDVGHMRRLDRSTTGTGQRHDRAARQEADLPREIAITSIAVEHRRPQDRPGALSIRARSLGREARGPAGRGQSSEERR